LPNYVAVNPFLGFAAQPLAEAAATIREGLGAEILPPADYYRARWRERAFDRADLVGAARRLGEDPSVLERVLDSVAPVKRQAGRTVLTHAERHDARHGTSWNALLINGAACWCAVHARQGGTFRFAPDCGDLYSGWREAAQADRSPEIAGLSGWRIWAKGLPCRAEEAIAVMLARLDVPPAERADYLYRLLGGVYGWASFLRRFSWESGDAPGPLLDLIAIRICADAAVPSLANKSGHVLKQLGYASMDGPTRLTEEAWAAENKQEDKQTFEDEGTRLIFQEALEDGFVRSLLADMAAAPQSPRAVRPAVQAVFCIDTRSEVLRRHLEAVAPAVETLGFAGFFGVSLSWQEDGSDSARCPVLLKPGVRAWPADRASPNGGVALKYVQSAPAASFTFVELLGLAYGVRLAGDASASAAAKTSSEGTAAFQFAADSSEGDAALEDHSKARLDLAAGILGNLGLRSRFGRLFLLCGHQGSSANNPHAASLDCGACGGHGGAINARVAAALLNDPALGAEEPRLCRAGRHPLPAGGSPDRHRRGDAAGHGPYHPDASPRPRPAAGMARRGRRPRTGGTGVRPRLVSRSPPEASGLARRAAAAGERLVGGTTGMGSGPQRGFHRRSPGPDARRGPGGSRIPARVRLDV